MIDCFVLMREKILNTPISSELDVVAKDHSVVTLHRPSNVDNKEILAKLVQTLVDSKPFSWSFLYTRVQKTNYDVRDYGLGWNQRQVSDF